MKRKYTHDATSFIKNKDEKIIGFPWGEIIKIHTIGEFDIIEYLSNIENEIFFHPYINGEDTNRSSETLEIALLDAIGVKNEGCNSHFAFYANKMLQKQ